MEIKVKYIETPVEKIKVTFKEAGRKGGSAKVPKGFSMMDKEKLREMSRKAANKRWGKENG